MSEYLNIPNAFIVGIIVFFVITLVPSLIYSKSILNKRSKFIEDNNGNSILQIFGTEIEIDGHPLSSSALISEKKGGKDPLVSLSPGAHNISAHFSAKRSVDRFKAGKFAITLDLEPGFFYTIGGYEYSASQRYSYYKGDVPEEVFELQVGDHFLICYKEDTLENVHKYNY